MSPSRPVKLPRKPIKRPESTATKTRNIQKAKQNLYLLNADFKQALPPPELKCNLAVEVIIK